VEAGADIVKVFPADVVGPAFFQGAQGPLPQIRVMPTGGVDLGTAATFLKAGACCLGIGSQLVEPKAVASAISTVSATSPAVRRYCAEGPPRGAIPPILIAGEPAMFAAPCLFLVFCCASPWSPRLARTGARSAEDTHYTFTFAFQTLRLLTNPAVQQDMKLDADQLKGIAKNQRALADG